MFGLQRPTTLLTLLAAGASALPSSQWCGHRYRRAKHDIQLYKSTDQAEANYQAAITVNDQTILAMVDSGSSDTWFIPAEGFQCRNTTTGEAEASEDVCGFFGPKIMPDASFESLDEHFNLSYAIGYKLYARTYNARVAIGDIDFPKQKVGLVKWAQASFKANVTGLIGLSYPAIDNLYSGDDGSTDRPCNLIIGANTTGCDEREYSTFMKTLVDSGIKPPVVVFALSRDDTNGGLMSFGGLPQLDDPRVNVTKESVHVTVPIEKPYNVSKLTQYTTTVDGWTYPGAPAGAGKGQYILDTGTVPCIVGKDKAQAFVETFDPPGSCDESMGCIVNCTAVAPAVSVSIGGKEFPMQARDLVVRGPPEAPYCFSGLQPSVTTGQKINILGSLFIRNLLAVFDVGSNEMTLVSRTHYQET
jgi:hypothetical protein